LSLSFPHRFKKPQRIFQVVSVKNFIAMRFLENMGIVKCSENRYNCSGLFGNILLVFDIFYVENMR